VWSWKPPLECSLANRALQKLYGSVSKRIALPLNAPRLSESGHEVFLKTETYHATFFVDARLAVVFFGEVFI